MKNANETITQKLERIAAEICDGYCKYREGYEGYYGDEDEGMDKLHEEKCSVCPLMEL